MIPWAMIVKGISSTIGGVANSIDHSESNGNGDGEATGNLIGKGISSFTNKVSSAPITLMR